jgi:hypothetical protein
MRTLRCLAISALVAPAILLAGRAPAQEITGQLIDSATGLGIPNAAIVLSSVEEGGADHGAALTDSQGNFRLRAPAPGRYRLRVARIGYAPLLTEVVEIGARERLDLELRTAPAPVDVEGVEVTSTPVRAERSRGLERWGFYDRQRMGFGTFITRAEIEERRPADTPEIFRGRAGFRLVQGAAGTGYRVISTRGPQGCNPDIYLDGIYLAPVDRRDVLYSVPWTDIEGIEAYPSPFVVPPRFQRQGRTCAVIAIWTR